MTTLFQSNYRALVIGAQGAIGKAFASALQQDPRCSHVEQVSRSRNHGFDLRDERSIAAAAHHCAAAGPYHLIVDATGALTMDGVGPEKSLAHLHPDHLAKAFQVNAIGPVMALRHFAPLLAAGPAIYAKLSARVGSIADNRKGGWYGYRASKAALNMLLHTAAIELQRKHTQLRVVALQPGTVRSALSHPVSAGAESVAGMLSALQNLPPRHGAHFIDYQGKDIPW